MKTFIAFDFETTGLKSQKNEIIEYAFVKFKDGLVIDQLCGLVKPVESISPKITSLTGITNEMVKDCEPLNKHIFNISKFIGNDPLVGHNAIGFDKKFLNVAFYKNKIYHHENRVFCTMQLTMDLLNVDYYIKLIDAVANLEIIPLDENFHRAENDAYCAGQIFQTYLNENKYLIEKDPNFLKEISISLKNKKPSI